MASTIAAVSVSSIGVKVVVHVGRRSRINFYLRASHDFTSFLRVLSFDSLAVSDALFDVAILGAAL